MGKYNVIFTQYHVYNVEADNEDDAENIAYEIFRSDMRYPAAMTFYDEVEVRCAEK